MNVRFRDKDDMVTFLRLLRMRTDARLKGASEDESKLYGSLFYRALEVIDMVLPLVSDLSEKQLLDFIEIIKDLDYAHIPNTKKNHIELDERVRIITNLFHRLEAFANTLPDVSVGNMIKIDFGKKTPPKVEHKEKVKEPEIDLIDFSKRTPKPETHGDRFVSLDEHGRGYVDYNIVDGRLVPPQDKTQVVIAAHSSKEVSQTNTPKYVIPDFMKQSGAKKQPSERVKPNIVEFPNTQGMNLDVPSFMQSSSVPVTEMDIPTIIPFLDTKKIVGVNPQSEEEQMKIYANKIGKMIEAFRNDDLLEQHSYMFDYRDMKTKPYWRVRLSPELTVRYEKKSGDFINGFSRLAYRLIVLSKKVVGHLGKTYGNVDDVFTMKTIYDYLYSIYKAKVEVRKLYKSVRNFDMMDVALTNARSIVNGIEFYFYEQEMPQIKDDKGVSKKS